MTAAVGIAGILFWLGLYIYSTKVRAVSFRQIAFIIIITGLTVRVLFALLTPCFYAPDEESHFNYIKFLNEKKEFPVQLTKTGDPANEWEYHQPPLYYLVLAPAYKVADFLFKEDIPTKVILLRIFSILLWLINIWLAFKILRLLAIEDVFIKTMAISIVSLLPTYTFISSVINNDNLLITIGGLILYLLLEDRTLRNSLLIGTLLGLAMLTKHSAIVYTFATAAVFMGQSWKKKISLKSACAYLTMIMIIALIIWSPWAFRNLKLYGDVIAEKATNTMVAWPSLGEAILYTQNYMKESFWAVSGIYNNVHFLVMAGVFLTYLSFAGLLYNVFIKKSTRPLSTERGRYLAAMAVATLVNIILLMRYGILWGQGQGRHLFPMLIPIAIFIAVGIKQYGIINRSKTAGVHAAGFFICYALSFLTHSILAFRLL